MLNLSRFKFGVWARMAGQSAWSRRGPLALVVAAISVSVFLVLSVSQLRQDAKNSFAHAVSGVDLIVGSRASPTELMLYSVFHLGRPARSISFDHYEDIVQLPEVAWALPLQMGDTSRGSAVVGTTPMFFSKMGGASGLEFAQGEAFSHIFDVVLGAEVAARMQHTVGEKIELTHGKSDGLAETHSDTPFTITGILRPTGTPVDRSVFISLAGFEAIHIGWELGTKPTSSAQNPVAAQTIDPLRLQPYQVTAVLVGLQARQQVFTAKRKIEALSPSLMAILPGVTLDELWQVMAVAEQTLNLMAWLVAFSALLGVSATLLISLASRRKELAILRAVGASPGHVMWFVLLESFVVCLAGILLGWAIMHISIFSFSDLLRSEFGVIMSHRWPDTQGQLALGGLAGVSFLASLIPAWRAYRLSLHDGLNPPVI